MRRDIAWLCALVALLVVGWSGGHFWLQGGTEHLNSYLILLLGLALTETGRPSAEQGAAPPVYEERRLEPLTQ